MSTMSIALRTKLPYLTHSINKKEEIYFTLLFFIVLNGDYCMSTIKNITIEVTRRCNFKCEHCMRGNVQDIDFHAEILYLLPHRYTEIETLSFTGGEPFLVPHIIQECLAIFRKRKVRIKNILIVTNGSLYDNDVCDMINECVLNSFEKCKLFISNDDYHVWNESVKATTKQLIDNHNAKILSRRQNIIAMGNAIVNDVANCKREEWRNHGLEIGFVHITAKGMITNAVDASYELADERVVCSLDQLHIFLKE